MFEFIKALFREEEDLKVNQKPLEFTPKSISKIKKHLSNLPPNIKSGFKIEVQHKKEGMFYHVGFEEYKNIRKTTFNYPVPIIISEKDEILLRGSKIDYDSKQDSFYIYPEIEIEVEDTVDSEIIKVYINRNVISPNSPIAFLAISKMEWSKDASLYPILVSELFSIDFIHSVYLKENYIQLEKNTPIPWSEIEERVMDVIMSYFERYGYPIIVEKDKAIVDL